MGYIGATIDLGQGFAMWSQVRFVGSRFLANDLANGFDKLSGYAIWDAKLSYSFPTRFGKGSAFFALNNILDREYEEFAGIGGFPFGSRIGFFPSPERNWLGGLKIVF